MDAEGFVVPVIPSGEDGGITNGQEGDQVPDEIAAAGGVAFGGIGGHIAGLFEEFLTGLGFDEAAVAPFIEVCLVTGSPPKSRAKMAWTAGEALSQSRREAPSSLAERRRLSSSRMGRGRRAILPWRGIIVYFVMVHYDDHIITV